MPNTKVRPRAEQGVVELPIINDVDDMLREGVSLDSIASFIQETMGLMKNCARSSLIEALSNRRHKLPQKAEVEEWPAADQDVIKTRTPGELARNQYRRTLRGIDRMLEVESLYLSVRDRIDWLISQEKTSDTHNEKLYQEYNQARELLETHAKLEREFGAMANRFRMSIDVASRSDSELGQHVQKVLENPESRHKVVDLVKRMKQAANIQAKELAEKSKDS